MTSIQKRALSYIRQVYAGREIQMDERGNFNVRSSVDGYGKTYFYPVAYIGTRGWGRDCLISCAGDSDEILVNLA